MRRYANKRDEVEAQVVKALRQMGVVVYLTDQPFDGILGYRNKTYLFEAKDPSKKDKKNEFTTPQLKFMETWKGGDVVVLRSTQDALEWVNSVEDKR